jgi:hypothetical protein
MRRLLILLAVCACASPSGGSQTDETTPRQAAIFQSAETGTLMGERPHASVASIAAPPAAVYAAAKKVYAAFDVPLKYDSPATGQLGNDNFFKSRSFAGRPMTELADCGSGMTGPKAASYRINISLMTQIVPDGKGGTKLQTTFVPMGQDVAGGSSDKIPCGTTGRLEQLFNDKVSAEVTMKMP